MLVEDSGLVLHLLCLLCSVLSQIALCFPVSFRLLTDKPHSCTTPVFIGVLCYLRPVCYFSAEGALYDE